MLRPKKMQVFVSSTYTDLKEERQAAVEAILTAGHIPAGMELFAAGDQTQMDVIRRWIDDSDVFLLILGGRYGTLDRETGKSYVHLEYEYAVDSGKPVFAIVIDEAYLDERVRVYGIAVVERDNAAALRGLREIVTTRIVRFWRDPRDIKLAILETLPEFARRDNIEGWVRASAAVDVTPLAEEVARLSRENAGLREQLGATTARPTYNGLTFDELYGLLAGTEIPRGLTQHEELLVGIAGVFGDNQHGLLHAFWLLSGRIAREVALVPEHLACATKLEEFGLIIKRDPSISEREFRLTPAGQQFLLRLRQARNLNVGEELRLA
jgi:hypothetical protein